MAFCINCGQKLVENAKFCANCGNTIVNNNTIAQRKTVYEGELHKCPCCGALIHSFTAACSLCGYEPRGVRSVNSVRELAQKLEAIEALRETTNPKSSKRIFTKGEITKTDEQKISLIRSFAIPNTKEDLYEFLILSGSNIDIDLYDDANTKTEAQLAISNAWKAKFEQAYQKAKLVFGRTSEFSEIQSMYDSIHKAIKKAKRKAWKFVGMLWGIVCAIFLFSVIVIIPMAERDEEKRLNEIIVKMETALKNDDYKLALMHADSLVPKDNFDEEFKREWKIQREYWIDKIIEEAAANGVILIRPTNETENMQQTSAEGIK